MRPPHELSGMFESSAVGHLTAAAVVALALGSLATFVRLLPQSETLLSNVLTAGFVVAVVAVGVVVGSRDRSDSTAYW